MRCRIHSHKLLARAMPLSVVAHQNWIVDTISEHPALHTWAYKGCYPCRAVQCWHPTDHQQEVIGLNIIHYNRVENKKKRLIGLFIQSSFHSLFTQSCFLSNIYKNFIDCPGSARETVFIKEQLNTLMGSHISNIFFMKKICKEAWKGLKREAATFDEILRRPHWLLERSDQKLDELLALIIIIQLQIPWPSPSFYPFSSITNGRQ